MEILSEDDARDMFVPKRKEPHPWQDWTDGKARVATRGEDYTTTVEQFTNNGRVWASRHGYAFSARLVGDDQVAFKMVPKGWGFGSP